MGLLAHTMTVFNYFEPLSCSFGILPRYDRVIAQTGGSGRRAGPGAMTQEADIPPPPRVVVDEDPESSAAFKVRPRG
jgi:hypothetical protein